MKYVQPCLCAYLVQRKLPINFGPISLLIVTYSYCLLGYSYLSKRYFLIEISVCRLYILK